ncbi:MAG: hypothetical protein IJB48_02920 [Clostridia bacterium]|nr:hypothetical protein [Clostridia bacterium]
MNMKYYNASNHFSAPIPRTPKPSAPFGTFPSRREVVVPRRPSRPEPPPHKPQSPTGDAASSLLSLKNLNLSDLKPDDLLILGVIALLIFNSCEDTMLLLALGYLFFVGL